MRKPLTYIGFFQNGVISSNEQKKPVYFTNFYPVYCVDKDGRIKFEFPNESTYYGRLKLRKQWTDKKNGEINERNVLDTDIDKYLKEGTLVKVILDSEYLVTVYDKQNVERNDCIRIPENVPVENAIKIETIHAKDIFFENFKEWFEIIDLKNISVPQHFDAKIACAIDDYERFLPTGFRVSVYDETRDIYSNLVDLMEPKPDYDQRYTLRLDNIHTWYKSLPIDADAMPYHAGEWTPAGFDSDTRYTVLNKRNPDAVPIKGSLVYKGNKYEVELEKSKGRTAIDPPSIKRADEADLVQRFTNYLLSSGRVVTEADVINYCTCLTQSFITTFAGAPGTGKTTLCRLLAQAMGLKEEDGSSSDARYAEIAVERGWSSVKDFIGYPDPFSKAEPNKANIKNKKKEVANSQTGMLPNNIIPSNIDACSAFWRMHNKTEAESNPPYLMLLDEANLSPIEYYWAQFLRNCQMDDDRMRKIQVSPEENWNISDNLRFLATVNFDHTTEELSPRFLDRSWVITLDAPEGELPPVRYIDGPQKTVAMKDLKDNFGVPEEAEFPGELSGIWTKVKNIFRDDEVRLPLSPRNILAVENYCKANVRWAEKGYLRLSDALDLAVLQKILPTISGYGKRYANLITRLTDQDDEDLQKLTRTQKKLQQMKEAAEENSGFYQFFIR